MEGGGRVNGKGRAVVGSEKVSKNSFQNDKHYS